MPTHTVHFDALADTVAALEQNGEEIVAAFAANDSTAVIVTRPKAQRRAGGRETR